MNGYNGHLNCLARFSNLRKEEEILIRGIMGKKVGKRKDQRLSEIILVVGPL